jgi:hypothetical protein
MLSVMLKDELNDYYCMLNRTLLLAFQIVINIVVL